MPPMRSQSRLRQAHDKERFTTRPIIPGVYPDDSTDELDRRLSVYITERQEQNAEPITKSEFVKWVKESPTRVYDVVAQIFQDEKKVYRQREAQLNTTINNLRQQLNEALNEVDHSERIIQERESSIIQLKTRLRETSVATNISSTSAPIAARPLDYKHTKFNGQAKNLSRFVNRLENDFCLFASNFPNEQTKVAYAMSGLGEQPDEWAQQFLKLTTMEFVT
ncbi:hypothetical protein KEM54_004385, partial [Ascosphaera aggregata]